MNLLQSLPEISVVVATYNGERFIREQMNSILQQSYPNFEVIVVDDASTDATMQVLDELAKEYPTITIIKNKENLGYVRTFERGFSFAKGSFIAPSDQDDVWQKDKLQVLMDNIQDYEIAYCDSELIDEEGKKTGKKLSDIKRLISFNNPLMYAIGNTAAGHAMLIKKSTIEDSLPFPTMIPHDYWLGFVATFSSGLNYVDKPLVLYRQHSANVFGVDIRDIKRKKKKEKYNNQIKLARKRMLLQYEKCPGHLKEKSVYYTLYKSYQNFSLRNNFIRMLTFFKYRDMILAYKRRSTFRKCLFCIKMFVKIM